MKSLAALCALEMRMQASRVVFAELDWVPRFSHKRCECKAFIGTNWAHKPPSVFRIEDANAMAALLRWVEIRGADELRRR
jgi:hypothetical protein